MKTINQIIKEQDDIFDGRIEGGDFDNWKTREIDPQEIKIYIHSRDKAILEGVIEMVEEKKKYTGGGTKEREMIYNSAISDIIKIIQAKI